MNKPYRPIVEQINTNLTVLDTIASADVNPDAFLYYYDPYAGAGENWKKVKVSDISGGTPPDTSIVKYLVHPQQGNNKVNGGFGFKSTFSYTTTPATLTATLKDIIRIKANYDGGTNGGIINEVDAQINGLTTTQLSSLPNSGHVSTIYEISFIDSTHIYIEAIITYAESDVSGSTGRMQKTAQVVNVVDSLTTSLPFVTTWFSDNAGDFILNRFSIEVIKGINP